MKRLFTLLSLCLTLSFLSAPGLAKDKEILTIGNMQIETLVDEADEGDTSILLGASPEMLQEYIPTGKYPTVIASTLIRDGDQIILIDTGLGNKLAQNLQERNIDPADVKTILITHMHFDHINGLVRDGKAFFPNAKIYIAEPELAYWTNDDNISKVPEQYQSVMKEFFKNSQNILAAYEGNIVPFMPGELAENGKTLFPGINAIAAYGHTPGHTVFLLHNENNKLLVLADTLHVGVIQFPRPDVSVTYDLDPEQAAKTRSILFAYAATHAIPIAGMHQAQTTFGLLKPHPKEENGYTLEPLQ